MKQINFAIISETNKKSERLMEDYILLCNDVPMGKYAIIITFVRTEVLNRI